jgi:murein DD-endopeptidase MepM/ murein hydrolase activator NlpD
MKKSLYYYSEKHLKYVEVKRFYSKFLTLIVIFSLIFSSLFLGGYLVVNNLIHPESDLAQLKNENKNLKEKYIKMSSQITQINSQVEHLFKKEDALRLSVNLDPLNEDQINFGIGGNAFKAIDLSSVSELNAVVDKVDKSLNMLNSKFLVVKNNYTDIENSLNENISIYRSIPAIIPTDGPIGDRFGMRSHPILKIRRMHTGIDILVNNGENIYAPGDGIVVKANNRSGYGKTIEIDHGHGYTTLYAHLSKLKVKQGQSVKRGDLLGLSGETGSLATGPHLHYEVKHNGVHLNPKNFIFSDIKAFDLTTEEGSN